MRPRGARTWLEAACGPRSLTCAWSGTGASSHTRAVWCHRLWPLSRSRMRPLSRSTRRFPQRVIPCNEKVRVRERVPVVRPVGAAIRGTPSAEARLTASTALPISSPRMARRRGTTRAIPVVAQSLLMNRSPLLRDTTPSQDPGADVVARREARRMRPSWSWGGFPFLMRSYRRMSLFFFLWALHTVSIAYPPLAAFWQFYHTRPAPLLRYPLTIALQHTFGEPPSPLRR
jgi:hypothetical protein